jgi:hypothetical protein
MQVKHAQDPSYKTPTNHEQARGLKDPHDSLKTLSIQGNTNLTNQNAPFSLPWMKGPTKHATDIRLRQVTQNLSDPGPQDCAHGVHIQG